MVEVFKSTSLRRMTTGGNYINVSADVVLASDYASLEAELKAAQEALEQISVGPMFAVTDVEKWAAWAAEIARTATLSQPPVGERGWQEMGTAPKDHFILLYCEEDQSIWLAKWQGGLWYGCDDLGLTRSGHTAGDPNVVTGWAVNGWRPLPSLPASPGREG